MRFAERVYALCKQIPRGKVSTYGALARTLNSSPRAVGQALKRNPYAPKVPCHRVVASDGRIGGFMGACEGMEVGRKMRLLAEEGVVVSGGEIVGFKNVFWQL